MSAPLRATAYTAYNVHGSRIKAAILDAAGVWHDAGRNVTDCESAVELAKEADNEPLAVMLEYMRLDAVAHREHAFWNVYTLVCGYREPGEWEGVASNGMRYRVVWSGPRIAQISIVLQN